MKNKSRVGYAEVKITKKEYMGNDPLHNKWIGTAEINGEEWQFSTEIDNLVPNKKYSVVYEKTEILPGRTGIKIRELI